MKVITDFNGDKIDASIIAFNKNGKDKQLDNVLNNIKIDILFSGKKVKEERVNIPTYKNYDLIIIIIESDWGRAGHILIPKNMFGESKNFEIHLIGSGGLTTFFYNPINMPDFLFETMENPSNGWLEEIIGISF